jgi:hypothetical protein
MIWAARKPESFSQPQGEPGVILGRWLGGERVLPTRGRDLVLPFDGLSRHVLILGASGAGKTETALRIADGVSGGSDAQVFYLDAKGDRATAERFIALMRRGGRRCRVFPNERFSAWRGDWRGIVSRLLEVIAFVREGPAAYYRDIAKSTLQLACHHPQGPPRSSAELLHRLDFDRLLDAHGPTSAILALPRDKVSQVRMRYEAYFGQLGSAFDGEWSWEDTEAGYLLLDSAATGEDALTSARLLFADFAHYFATRKKRDKTCLLIVDEFSALSGSSDLAAKLEQARSFNTGLVLAPQVIEGMGPAQQRERLLGSIEVVISHSLNNPTEIAELAGERLGAQLTHNVNPGPDLRVNLVRPGREPRLHPDRLRRLSAGEAWLIRRGRGAHIRVHRTVADRGTLPVAQPLDSEPKRRPVTAPKQIAYLEERA